MEKDTNIGYRQAKLDTQAYETLKEERARLRSLGMHASFSDAFRSLVGKKRPQKKKETREEIAERLKHSHDGSQIQASSIMRLQEGLTKEESEQHVA